jgi:hypothetical protein
LQGQGGAHRVDVGTRREVLAAEDRTADVVRCRSPPGVPAPDEL